MATKTKPAFRKPWEHGAKAYHEADSLEAIGPGIKRLRSPLTVLILHETGALDGVLCDACGEDLAGPYTVRGSDEPDNYAMIDVDPRSKTYVARHYYCAWNALLGEIERHRLVMEGRA